MKSDFTFYTAGPEGSLNEDLMPMLSGASLRHPSDGDEMLTSSFRKQQSQSSGRVLAHRSKREYSSKETAEDDKEYQNTKMVELYTVKFADTAQDAVNETADDCKMDNANSAMHSDTSYSSAQES